MPREGPSRRLSHAENWPSVYFDEKTKMLLIIYVDDLLLSGPKELMEPTWAKLGDVLKLAKPPGDDDDVHRRRPGRRRNGAEAGGEEPLARWRVVDPQLEVVRR